MEKNEKTRLMAVLNTVIEINKWLQSLDVTWKRLQKVANLEKICLLHKKSCEMINCLKMSKENLLKYNKIFKFRIKLLCLGINKVCILWQTKTQNKLHETI